MGNKGWQFKCATSQMHKKLKKKTQYGTKNLSQGVKSRVRVFADIQNSHDAIKSRRRRPLCVIKGRCIWHTPLFDSPSGCCSVTRPRTVTRSSLRMLRRVAAFCWPLRPVLLLVSFPRPWSPIVGVLGLCGM